MQKFAFIFKFLLIIPAFAMSGTVSGQSLGSSVGTARQPASGAISYGFFDKNYPDPKNQAQHLGVDIDTPPGEEVCLR